MWDDLFLVLACDGVWDVLDDQRTVEIAADALSEGGASAAAAAVVRGEHDRLQSTFPRRAACSHRMALCVAEAYNKQSLDNLTATVVQFGWHSIGEIAATMEAARSREKKAEKKKKKQLMEEEIDIFA